MSPHRAAPDDASAPVARLRADCPGRTALATPEPRSLAQKPASTPAGHSATRLRLSLDQTYLRQVVDPWVSTSSAAPVVELRRDPDDRPASADPPVAVRWRAIDVDRLGIEQRVL